MSNTPAADFSRARRAQESALLLVLAVLAFAGWAAPVLAQDAAAPKAPGLDPRIGAVLLAGALAVKLTMTLLDKSGALEKLPPWLRPQVTIVLAAVVALLESLAGGVDLPAALVGFLGAIVFSDKAHQTIKGEARAGWLVSVVLLDGHGVARGHARHGGGRVWLSPERAQHEDWQRLIRRAGRVIQDAVQSGVNSKAIPGEVPHDLILRAAMELGPVLCEAYEIGTKDGAGRERWTAKEEAAE